MWEAMLAFLAKGCAARLAPLWSFAAWTAVVRAKGCTIRAANVDLLFRLSDAPPPAHAPLYDALSFVAPRTVVVERRERREALPAGHVEIAAEASLISTGTELKFYRGDFGGGADDNPAERVPIVERVAERRILERGDRRVERRVVVAAAGVEPSLLGQRVFAFHPHASAAVAAADGVQRVPDGVGASDAVYLPALETALSIAHDAHVRPGESTLVVGQGLIGLLVTAVLARAAPGADVVAVDPLGQRRALARKLGATRTLARGVRRDRLGCCTLAREQSTGTTSRRRRGAAGVVDRLQRCALHHSSCRWRRKRSSRRGRT